MERWSCVPATPARRDAWLALFAASAATDAASACASCCCNLYTLAPAIDFAALDRAANQTAAAARFAVGETDGYLACTAHGTADGWLNVQPRHRVPHAFARLGLAPPPLRVAPHDAAVILCLVADARVAAATLASALIAGALAGLAARGLHVVDVCPARAATRLQAHEPGPAAWYAAAGFDAIGGNEERVVMRRVLR